MLPERQRERNLSFSWLRSLYILPCLKISSTTVAIILSISLSSLHILTVIDCPGRRCCFGSRFCIDKSDGHSFWRLIFRRCLIFSLALLISTALSLAVVMCRQAQYESLKFLLFQFFLIAFACVSPLDRWLDDRNKMCHLWLFGLLIYWFSGPVELLDSSLFIIFHPERTAALAVGAVASQRKRLSNPNRKKKNGRRSNRFASVVVVAGLAGIWASYILPLFPAAAAAVAYHPRKKHNFALNSGWRWARDTAPHRVDWFVFPSSCV